MKMFRLVIVIMSVLFIVGCSNDTGNTQNEGKSKDTRSLRVSGMSPEDHPNTLALMDFAEIIEEKTNGDIQFDIYPANQLGDYTSVYEEVMKGTIDMALLSVPSQFDSRTEVLNMPYLVENYEQAKELFSDDSYVYQLVEEIMLEQGIKLLGIRPQGFGGIGTTKEVKSSAQPGEDKGVMVRIPQMEVYRTYAEGMGFRTVSIPYADVYTALQTGTAEGVVGSIPSSNYLSFRDVITHYYQYNNTFEGMALIVNSNVWDGFSEEEQKVFSEAGKSFTIKSIEDAEKIDREYLDKLKEEGIEVVEYSEEEINNIANYIRENVWLKNKDSLGDEILKELQEEIN